MATPTGVRDGVDRVNVLVANCGELVNHDERGNRAGTYGTHEVHQLGNTAEPKLAHIDRAEGVLSRCWRFPGGEVLREVHCELCEWFPLCGGERRAVFGDGMGERSV